MEGKFLYAFGKNGGWPDQLKCLMCPFCEISTSCDENIHCIFSGDIYFWCKSCGAKSICEIKLLTTTKDEVQKICPDLPSELKDIEFYKFELKFIKFLSCERSFSLFRADVMVKPEDIVQFFADLHNERKFNMETFIKNNKIAKKYNIEPTPGTESMLIISVNSYNLSCPDVPYPKNIDLLWKAPVLTCIQEEYYLHRWFPWGNQKLKL